MKLLIYSQLFMFAIGLIAFPHMMSTLNINSTMQTLTAPQENSKKPVTAESLLGKELSQELLQNENRQTIKESLVITPERKPASVDKTTETFDLKSDPRFVKAVLVRQNDQKIFEITPDGWAEVDKLNAAYEIRLTANDDVHYATIRLNDLSNHDSESPWRSPYFVPEANKNYTLIAAPFSRPDVAHAKLGAVFIINFKVKQQ